MDELKRTDMTAYDNLVVLLTYFHFTTVYSRVLDDDVSRYQKEKFDSLTR